MMKKIFSVLIAVILTANVFSQISYQAVIRDASNNLIKNQFIGMRVSIIVISGPTPHVLYQETYSPNPKTNANGLVTLEIGGGTPVVGSFSGINWTNGGSYLIKSETDPTGGTNYTITGSSALLYVPFAIHAQKADSANYLKYTIKVDSVNYSKYANKADSVKNSNPIKAGNNIIVTGSGTTASPYVINESIHKIGDSYGSGIVFYVYDNGRHGLIAATTDQSTGVVWTTSAYQTIVSNAVKNGVNGGQTNTERIIIQAGAGTYAAQLCSNYNGGNFTDWYLPSEYELIVMYSNIGQGAAAPNTNVGGFANNYYWSSSEYNNGNAWYAGFSDGTQGYGSKFHFTYYVRAIRVF